MFFPEIVSMHFQLTGRCNLKCIFCGQQNGMFEGKNREELPYEKWIAIAEEVRNLGSRPEIILWGGEPLLYSRFDELAEHLHRIPLHHDPAQIKNYILYFCHTIS